MESQKKKNLMVGGGSIGATLLIIGALTQVDNFSREFSPHKAAFAAQQKVSQLEQYIQLQQEYNRQLVEQQQSWQQWQMQQQQQQSYQQPYQQPYQKQEYQPRNWPRQEYPDYGTRNREHPDYPDAEYLMNEEQYYYAR